MPRYGKAVKATIAIVSSLGGFLSPATVADYVLTGQNIRVDNCPGT